MTDERIDRRPPEAFAGQRVIGEPRQLRHELAWTVELPDGRRAVIAQLAPELAAEPALRRRWVVDMERLAALPVSRLAPTLAIGPAPDPRAPDAEPPWRVRLDPAGTTLEVSKLSVRAHFWNCKQSRHYRRADSDVVRGANRKLMKSIGAAA